MADAAPAIEWDEAQFESVLERLVSEGTIDASGVRISAQQLERLVEAAPRDPDCSARSLLKDANFEKATFTGAARFVGATFSGAARFGGATFTGDAWFEGATFTGDAWFGAATFTGAAWFVGATFTGAASFEKATFTGAAWFGWAAFSGAARFGGATFTGDAWFVGATFERARALGPLIVWERAAFTGAVFLEQVTLRISAARVSLAGVVFRGGADLRVRWAQVELDDADFAAPSLVASLPPVTATESKSFLGWEELTDEGWRCRVADPPSGFEPRVVSMRRAKVGNLALSGVDLRACRFEGAHGLDQMRLEFVRFAETPSGWRWKPIPWRWTRRQVLAEEHQWRHPREGWYGEEIRGAGEESEPLPPERIAAIYRALRKGREDNKDEPGAADFYYGEMEMRRQKPQEVAAGSGDEREEPFSRSAGWGERLILRLYWLVSGYGLRASRALIALALTVVAFAFLFDWWGFSPDRHLGRALIFSIESTSSLFRLPETEGSALTPAGEVLQVVLRLLGPLFFALALLSVRGRVKR